MKLRSIVAPSQIASMAKLATNAPEGKFVEVGVFRGGSAQALYEVALVQGRELHLFDTFVGTPFYEKDLDRHKIDDEFHALDTLNDIKKALPNATLHIGIYPDTHPENFGNIAFIHCDCDQYRSYRAVIDNLWPLVVPGGMLLFDDYPYLAGAKLAVDESFAQIQLRPCGQRFYVTKPEF